MDWINPHAWLHIDVKGTDGKVVSWMIELGPPNALLKRGWTKKSVPIGIEVIVDGYQAKDGALRANGRDVTLPDGKQDVRGIVRAPARRARLRRSKRREETGTRPPPQQEEWVTARSMKSRRSLINSAEGWCDQEFLDHTTSAFGHPSSC